MPEPATISFMACPLPLVFCLMLRSYFASVVDLRADLFGLWERGGPLLAAADAQTMRGAIGRVGQLRQLSDS